MSFYVPNLDMFEDKKPPLGIKPRHIVDSERINEIGEAICRYLNEDYAIPLEWIEEYNELVGRIK